MSAITDLEKLLAHMKPKLNEGTFVFCTFPNKKYGDLAELNPICAYMESEGLTLILPQLEADRANIPYEGHYSTITLQVHSSLEAVGLTAAVATRLTQHNISANVVAAYFHDHIFVQSPYAAEAINALEKLAQEYQANNE